MKLKIISLLFITVFIASCSTQERAQRHLRKAIKLDASILKKDTLKITDTILVRDTIIVPEYISTIKPILVADTSAIDSLIKVISKVSGSKYTYKDFLKYFSLDTLIKDDRYSLQIVLKNGVLQHRLVLNEMYIPYQKDIYYEKDVEVDKIIVDGRTKRQKFIDNVFEFVVGFWWLIALIVIVVYILKKRLCQTRE